MAEQFLKQYQILFIKGKEDLVAARYLLDGFNHHNIQIIELFVNEIGTTIDTTIRN